MRAAYYGKDCDSSELFAPYKIAREESYQKHRNQYNVIMLNMLDFLGMTESVDEVVSCVQRRLIKELFHKTGYGGRAEV